MDNNNKHNTGAPSDDTTSALFVSARKKQLEQQEAERRAKEKEDQRLAAEAEVRRLEAEVEERRRKAEEDAKQVAEEARLKKQQAAENPDAILGNQPGNSGFSPQTPGASVAAPSKPASAGTGTLAGIPIKLLAIIGGGVAALVLIIVLIASLSGGGAVVVDTPFRSETLKLELLHPADWSIKENAANHEVEIDSDLGLLLIIDATQVANQGMQDGLELITVVEQYMQFTLADWVGIDVSAAPTPVLSKSGNYVTGSMEYTFEGFLITIRADVIENRLFLFLTDVKEDDVEEFGTVTKEILASLQVDKVGDNTNTTDTPDPTDAANTNAYGKSYVGESGFYENDYISFEYPKGWYILEFESSSMSVYGGPVAVSPVEITETSVGNIPIIFVADYTNKYNDNNYAESEEIKETVTRFMNDFVYFSGLKDQFGEFVSGTYGELDSDVNSQWCANTYTYENAKLVAQLELPHGEDVVVFGSMLIGGSSEWNDEVDATFASVRSKFAVYG